MRRRRGRRGPAPWMLALILLAAASGAASARERVAVIELTMVVSDDLPRFHDSSPGEAPARVVEGTLWLGPVAAQALRWSQSFPSVQLGKGVDDRAAIGGALILHEGHGGPAAATWQDRLLLERELPGPPVVPPPQRIVVDLTLAGTAPTVAPLWPADFSWHLEGADLVVGYAGERHTMAPGERMEIEVAALTLPLLYRSYEAAAKGAAPAADFPQPVERDGGTVTIATTLEILWHGALPMEIVE